jgi:hypothetical protein
MKRDLELIRRIMLDTAAMTAAFSNRSPQAGQAVIFTARAPPLDPARTFAALDPPVASVTANASFGNNARRLSVAPHQQGPENIVLWPVTFLTFTLRNLGITHAVKQSKYQL